VYDIVGKRNWYFAFSALLTIPGLVFILLGGLKPSVDFTGGTEWEVRHQRQPSVAEMRAALVDLGVADPIVESLPDGFLRIRSEPLDLLPPDAPPVTPTGSPGASPAGSPVGSPVGSPAASPATDTPVPSPAASPGVDASPGASPGSSPVIEPASPGASPGASLPPAPARDTEFTDLQRALEERFGNADVRSLRTVGPIIGLELIRSSAVIIIVGEIFILGYLWLRFGFRYGTCAIVALLHDVILVVGTFAILGYFFRVEFDALFVTALLTVIGFSVHDTIVVFDRIRENRIRHAGEPFGAVVNHSILQTMGRSIITSLTVVVTLTALLLLGPPTIRTFTLALLLGTVSGTYSSIFNAAQLLVAWHEWDARRRGTVRAARPARSASR
jgi:preprotein translocase SecF subunit